MVRTRRDHEALSSPPAELLGAWGASNPEQDHHISQGCPELPGLPGQKEEQPRKPWGTSHKPKIRCRSYIPDFLPVSSAELHGVSAFVRSVCSRSQDCKTGWPSGAGDRSVSAGESDAQKALELEGAVWRNGPVGCV